MDKREILRKAIAQNPDDPFAQYALAIEEREAGNADEARAGLEQVKERFPDYVPTYFHLGGLQAEAGDDEIAKQTYERGIEVAEAAADAHAASELRGALALLG